MRVFVSHTEKLSYEPTSPDVKGVRGFPVAWTAAALLIFFSLLLTPGSAFAWGANGQRLIANRAVDTLPPDVQSYFDANREFILRHVTDTLGFLEKTPNTEKPNHILYLDHYGKFPFDSLPRDYQTALAKFGRAKLLASGVLPWQIGVYSQRLTEAMHNGNWGQARLVAALLASYVADAHDPFLTTENFDGHLSGQMGVNQRFGVSLVDRYSLFFPMRPNDAFFISDPTMHAFDACLSGHSWLENILLADLHAKDGLNDYTDEYYDRFYNQVGATLIRQLTDAATDVGSYWLTAWINAGRPALPKQ
jgi:hypothetical protein